MENLTHVTGNYGKYVSVKKHFEKNNLSISFYNADLPEPEINDIELISQAKVLAAYNILKTPCFVADTGFYIDDYPNNPGYPGAFVKRSGISTNIDSLLQIMAKTTNRTCRFIDCLTFYDGVNFYTFYGISEGTLAKEKKGRLDKKAKSNLWSVFIPKNCGKTLAEMDDYELQHRDDGHTSATEEFITWYKNNYLKKSQKVFEKRNKNTCEK